MKTFEGRFDLFDLWEEYNMTNDTKYLCTECAARYRDNDFLVSERPRGVITGRCADCKKVKAVGGVLVGERSRR